MSRTAANFSLAVDLPGLGLHDLHHGCLDLVCCDVPGTIGGIFLPIVQDVFGEITSGGIIESPFQTIPERELEQSGQTGIIGATSLYSDSTSPTMQKLSVCPF